MKEVATFLENISTEVCLLRNFCGVVDEDRMPCASYIDKNVQSTVYEGHTTSVEVSSLFVLTSKGEVIHAGKNFPM